VENYLERVWKSEKSTEKEFMKEAVLIIGFNRPQKLKEVLEKVLAYDPTKLYVFCDAPREGVEGEAEKCSLVRNIVLSSGHPSLSLFFPKKNLGCKNGPPSAISWFFAHELRGIVLEDDIVPYEGFFEFCEKYLDEYENDSSIFLISGFNPLGFVECAQTTVLTKFPQIWGWATWRRAWSNYSNYITRKELDSNRKVLKSWINRKMHFGFWMENFNRVADQGMNTWDYQFVFHILKSEGYGILPVANLIRNIGFDGEATHKTERKYEFPSFDHDMDARARAMSPVYVPSIDRRIGRELYFIASRGQHDVRDRMLGEVKSLLFRPWYKIKRILGIKRVVFWKSSNGRRVK